mmetsp:Transcript_43708/g.78473  ORF Transcript_43708/g.78473 Transcript_43708/m.78473 type:complete len:431 (-) Transcript_43708:481-1773(-)
MASTFSSLLRAGGKSRPHLKGCRERHLARLAMLLAALGACLVSSFHAFVTKPPPGRSSVVKAPALGDRGAITQEELDSASLFTLIDEGDTYKEADRMFRRPVFGKEEWKKHRSSKRITKNLSSVFSSRIFRIIFFEVLLVALVAAFTTVFYDPAFASFVQQKLGDPTWKPFTVSMVPFTLTSFSLSLLLVFKTNNSYARWWEARIIWGGIVNTSRDIVRQALCRFQPKDNGLKEIVTGLSSAYSRILAFHLSDQTPADAKLLREQLSEMPIPESDVEDLMSATHKPMTVTGKLSHYIQKADLDTFTRLHLDQDLVKFSDFYGMCERIYKTPIPISYSRLTARFLSVWLLALPFALHTQLDPKWLVVPVSSLIATFIFGIEEMGVLIEEPFSVLPLQKMADGIKASIFEALEIDKKTWTTSETNQLELESS